MEERERPQARDSSWTRVPPQKSRVSQVFFSIFVANLTFDTSAEDLHRIFNRYGKLSDVFIPWNHNLNRSRGFAFIRFCYEQDAYNAIQCLNERRIDGRVVHVAWAKRQPDKRKVMQPPPSLPQSCDLIPTSSRVPSFVEVVARERPSKDAVVDKYAGETSTADPKAVENRLKLLSLAVVGTTVDEEVRIDRLSTSLEGSGFSLSTVDVVRISGRKFLITFRSKGALDKFRGDADLHKDMGLQEVEMWTSDEVLGRDGVWIRIFGIPAQAWIEAVILDLASYFGKIVQIDSNSRFGLFQAFARVKVIPTPGVSFSKVLRLVVFGKAYPIIIELEPLFRNGSHRPSKGLRRESTKDWVLRRFHTPSGCPSGVCGEVPSREGGKQQGYVEHQVGVCEYVTVGDKENARRTGKEKTSEEGLHDQGNVLKGYDMVNDADELRLLPGPPVSKLLQLTNNGGSCLANSANSKKNADNQQKIGDSDLQRVITIPVSAQPHTQKESHQLNELVTVHSVNSHGNKILEKESLNCKVSGMCNRQDVSILEGVQPPSLFPLGEEIMVSRLQPYTHYLERSHYSVPHSASPSHSAADNIHRVPL